MRSSFVIVKPAERSLGPQDVMHVFDADARHRQQAVEPEHPVAESVRIPVPLPARGRGATGLPVRAGRRLARGQDEVTVLTGLPNHRTGVLRRSTSSTTTASWGHSRAAAFYPHRGVDRVCTN